MISAIGRELEDLVQGHVGEPDVVLAVHGDHVGQEEEAGAPGVDHVAGRVDGQHGVRRDGDAAVATVRVVPVEGGRVPRPVPAVEDDRVAVLVDRHPGQLAQPGGGGRGRPVGDRAVRGGGQHFTSSGRAWRRGNIVIAWLWLGQHFYKVLQRYHTTSDYLNHA